MRQDRSATRPRWLHLLDILSILLLLTFAVLLRWNWEYRSAFVDEASTLFNGWLLLRGETIHTMAYQPTWPYLSMLPAVGWSDSGAGVQHALGCVERAAGDANRAKCLRHGSRHPGRRHPRRLRPGYPPQHIRFV
jgi:hypothetical protein